LGTRPPFRAADAAARGRFVLARPSDPRRSGSLTTTASTDWRPHIGRHPRHRERAYTLGRGFCCVCGQPVYRFGWHIDLWDSGANMNANWHCACVIAWQFWNAPSDYVRLLRRLQAWRCGQSGGRLWKSAEVDHRIPLFRVWSEHRETPWPDLLNYWGLPNFQVINAPQRSRSACDKESKWLPADFYLVNERSMAPYYT
jgi:hypothetical protein